MSKKNKTRGVAKNSTEGIRYYVSMMSMTMGIPGMKITGHEAVFDPGLSLEENKGLFRTRIIKERGWDDAVVISASPMSESEEEALRKTKFAALVYGSEQGNEGGSMFGIVDWNCPHEQPTYADILRLRNDVAYSNHLGDSTVLAYTLMVKEEGN